MTYSFQPVTPDARHRAARARRSSLDDFASGGFHFGIDEATALRSFDADDDRREHIMCTQQCSAPRPSPRASKMTRPPPPRQEAQVITDESAHGGDDEGHHPSRPPSFDDWHRREISANFGSNRGGAPSYDNWPRSPAPLERTRASPQSAHHHPGVVRRDRSVASLALGSVPLQTMAPAPAPAGPAPATEHASHLSFLAAMGQSQRSRSRVDVHCNDELRCRMDESDATRTALMKWARGALKGGGAVPGPLRKGGAQRAMAPFPSHSPRFYSRTAQFTPLSDRRWEHWMSVRHE
ncbi:hypothetical protein ACHAXT_005906 [Thalassiosira profunda]